MLRIMRIALPASFVIAVMLFSHRVSAGSPVYLGKKSVSSGSFDKVDHSSWDKLLRKYVDADGMVDYRSLKANREDVRLLDRYLATLSSASPRVAATRNAKLAFWINAYNAVTVRGILREYPTSSIRNHTARLFGYNIWNDLKLYVGGTAYSLDQMEHQILRKMSEPRIHFAVVCASNGCPRLLNEAYVADRLDRQLESNANDFFARKQNFRFEKGSDRIQLSSILDWYGDDFGSDQAAQLRKISKWLPSRQAADAALQKSTRVSFLDYDWKLNEQ